MSNIKILLCHNFYQHGGGESLVYENQVRGLKERGHDLSFYQRDNSDILSYSPGQKLGMLTAGFYSMRTRRELVSLVELEKPDVAIVQNVFPLISPAVYSVLHSLHVPIIQAVYNYRFICPEGELYTHGQICERCVGGNYLNAVAYRCYRGSYLQSAWYAAMIGLHRWLKTIERSVDIFMVPDDFLGKKLSQGGIPVEKIQRNPNPFFVHDFEPSEYNDRYFLYVGRLVPQKGIFTLLKAVERADRRVRLVIVGQGESQEAVEQCIREKGLADRVLFLGPKWGSELTEIMRRAAAVVIPSEWYDNLPLILCQANASGKAVIASRINGIPEYVVEGENGYLFEPGNADELAAVLNRVAGLDHSTVQDLSHAARRYAEDVFDYANHYQRLCQMIEPLLG